MAYDDSSRSEPKRSHPWIMDGVEAELFPNKKQAIEGPNPNLFSTFLNSNVSPWGNASNFHSAANQYSERLFDSEIVRNINYGDRNVASVGLGNMNMGRKVLEDSMGSDFSFGLSISHSLDDHGSGLNYGGIRKVKVSQVKDTDNLIPLSVGQTYNREYNSTMSMPHAFCKTDDNSASVGLSFDGGENSMIPMGNTFIREDNTFISMSQPQNKNDNNETLMCPAYEENGCTISLTEPLNKDQCSIERVAESFKSVQGRTVAEGHSLNMNSNVMSIGLPFRINDSSVLPLVQTFIEGAQVATSMEHSYNKVEDNSTSMSNSYNKIDNSDLSMGHSFGKGETKIISFGGFGDDDDLNSSERLTCSYELLMGQSPIQKSETVNAKDSVESNPNTLAKASQTTTSEIVSKKKEEAKMTKKPPSNNFPSNVRSLLSTGILDGVPVKYIAWSREKELRGTIKGSAYLCGCQSCNFSKAINAYEFERHAGCKTKHPNNHIYFENGKTIYGIVQELRNTPQNLLFEVIQTITGSPINHKSFRLWKESFLAATRELQRIYGKDEGKQFS